MTVIVVVVLVSVILVVFTFFFFFSFKGCIVVSGVGEGACLAVALRWRLFDRGRRRISRLGYIICRRRFWWIGLYVVMCMCVSFVYTSEKSLEGTIEMIVVGIFGAEV